MTVTYGFYNSLNGDRAYDARDISNMFTGIIADGVLATVGDGLIVKQTGTPSMDILVSSGRAWFDGTWTYNDADMVLTIEESDLVLDRIDLVVLEVNTDVSVRANEIKVLTGTPASSPVADTLIQTETLNQYPLAEIYISAGVTEVIDANITNKIGTVDCPFVTGLIDTIDADALLLQWDSDYNSWKSLKETDYDAWETQSQNEFDVWFQTVQDTLDGDTAGNLLNLIQSNDADILELQNDKADKTSLPITKTGLTLALVDWVDNTGTSGFFEQVITDSDVTTSTILDLYFDSQDIKDHMQDVGASYLIEQSGSYLIQMETAPLSDVNYKLIINKEV